MLKFGARESEASRTVIGSNKSTTSTGLDGTADGSVVLNLRFALL